MNVSTDTEDAGPYVVLMNNEEQYCIWPALKKVPAGWRTVLAAASTNDCLHYIDETWTDITPLSVRRRLSPPHTA